jgi:hypothetical protein
MNNEIGRWSYWRLLGNACQKLRVGNSCPQNLQKRIGIWELWNCARFERIEYAEFGLRMEFE